MDQMGDWQNHPDPHDPGRAERGGFQRQHGL